MDCRERYRFILYVSEELFGIEFLDKFRNIFSEISIDDLLNLIYKSYYKKGCIYYEKYQMFLYLKNNWELDSDVYYHSYPNEEVSILFSNEKYFYVHSTLENFANVKFKEPIENVKELQEIDKLIKYVNKGIFKFT